jgi:RNA polymerase sigma-70 factor (ECF subfamily)
MALDADNDAAASELLRRARAFDAEALTQLFDTHNGEVYRYAMRLVGDARLAEDCVAETFSRLLVALRKGQGPASTSLLRAYLLRVAFNWLMDEHRAHKRQPETVPLHDEISIPQLHQHESADVLHAANAAMQRERLRSALHTLTPEQRQVVALRFLEGWSLEETARALGKEVGAVKAMQHRALAAIRREMGIENEE